MGLISQRSDPLFCKSKNRLPWGLPVILSLVRICLSPKLLGAVVLLVRGQHSSACCLSSTLTHFLSSFGGWPTAWLPTTLVQQPHQGQGPPYLVRKHSLFHCGIFSPFLSMHFYKQCHHRSCFQIFFKVTHLLLPNIPPTTICGLFSYSHKVRH